jgi:hypothetical protein
MAVSGREVFGRFAVLAESFDFEPQWTTVKSVITIIRTASLLGHLNDFIFFFRSSRFSGITEQFCGMIVNHFIVIFLVANPHDIGIV